MDGLIKPFKYFISILPLSTTIIFKRIPYLSNSVAEGNHKSVLDMERDDLTPGMQQYQEAKRVHPDCLIMLRMGDFYEMFYQDAITASKELEITLTSRGKGDKRAPLAGVPYHALDTYLGRLIKKGYKVAIVEQLEDPKKAQGLVKRGVVRIVTPGTVIESTMLNDTENNYLLALTSQGDEFIFAICDLSTGEFFTAKAENSSGLLNEIARYTPTECIIPESLQVNTELVAQIKKAGCYLSPLEDYYFKTEKARELLLSHFNLASLDSFGLEEEKRHTAVCGALLKYLLDTQKNSLSHLKKISIRNTTHKMLLDSNTLRNLELIKNIKDATSRGTLLGVIDKTVTVMGSRLLKAWIKEPLLLASSIEQRLQAVAELYQQVIPREEIRELLSKVQDMERLISRINYGNATPRDVLALKNSLQQIPLIQRKVPASVSEMLHTIISLSPLGEVTALIDAAIREDAPLTLREGGIIKPSFNLELVELYHIRKNSTQYLQELEEKERQKTGIATLRINYTRVFGYFIEVTRKNIDAVPNYYIRKQTTANSERYITEDLKREEEKIIGAEEKIQELEYQLFQEIIKGIITKTMEIQDAATKLAVLDVLCSLAKVAQENHYVRPQLIPQNSIQIRNGRHPVVEQIESSFVPNDINLNPGEMMIITGPNMSGKSTVMRQVALIVLLAQMGSFVPADEAVLGIVDRIFTRVGAYDDLSSGQSTFMVEMSETASLLNNATEKSLIVLDEIGRGTSTFDGVSIAWSVAEHLCNTIKARTMFSTHYHVMNKLAEKFTKIKNYNIAVKEVRGQVIFLHKLVEGGTDESYGIHVAEMAGLPIEVVRRAREIQEILQKDDEMMRRIKAKKLEEQKSLGEYHF